jgi:glycine C-acetyltransferase
LKIDREDLTIMGKLDFIEKEMKDLKEQGLLKTIRTISSPQGAWIEADGKRVLNLCSNNYLGFANDERLRQASIEGIQKFGVGPGAVRTIAGTMTLHKRLEELLARFKKVEATLSFQSGFNANVATIPAFVGQNDLIFSDELNHASIIDGCRLSKAEIIRYEHCNPGDLQKKLGEQKDNPCHKLVITDGVFSMDGDFAPLDKIVEVASRYEAMTMVDDAHGEGVLGSAGRGIVDHFHLHGQVDLEIGTLSKAFGVIGGFVSGKKALIEYLEQKARPYGFSSAVPPSDVCACIAGVEILMKSGELVEKLWDNARYFKEKMAKLGFNLGLSKTPITPVMIGDARIASRFSARLFEEEVFAQPIGYPLVAQGKARIRVMISACHSRQDLDFGADVFGKIGKELGVIPK